MEMDRPNQLDDLWTDWEKKTLEQKQALLKKAVNMGSKVLFSRQDGDNLAKKAHEVAKALNLVPSEKAIVTPSRTWMAKHDPEYQRLMRTVRKLKPGERLPRDLDPWAPEAYEELERRKAARAKLK